MPATILEVLARDHVFSVATTQAGTYTPISGINKWTWAESPGDVDARTFDDGGHAAKLVVSRDITATLEGQKQVDFTTNTRDAGQAIVDSANSGANFGRRRIRYFKIAMNDGAASPLEIGNVTFAGSTKPKDMGGGNDDLLPWGVEIMVYGRPISASGIYSDLY
jgi:hypothetical protein